MILNAFRWIVAIPAGIAASFVAQLLVSVALSLSHGFETIASFWEANDMNGMPVSGTYVVLATRFISSAALVSTVAAVVPAHRKRVAKVISLLLLVASGAWFAFLFLKGLQVGATEVGVWYRAALELAGIVGGCLAAARTVREPAPDPIAGITLGTEPSRPAST